MSEFDYFDSARKENFLSALLLLAMKLDPNIHSAMEYLLGEKLGYKELKIVDKGREAAVSPNSASYQDKRCDIWLRCTSGESERFLVVIEVKANGDWAAKDVLVQMGEYDDGTILRFDQKVQDCVALVPDRLAKELCDDDSSVKAFTWSELIKKFREEMDANNRLSVAAVEHFREVLGREAGDEKCTMPNVEVFLRQHAILQGLLIEIAEGLGGTVRGVAAAGTTPMFVQNADGKPRTQGEYCWLGMEMQFKWRDDLHYVGIYHYSKNPESKDGNPLTRVEVWQGSLHRIAQANFSSENLGPSNLAEIKKQLFASVRKTTP